MTGVLKPLDLQALSIFLCIKVALVTDPAVGSGAFPLGMLNEIVRARQNITTYMDITQKIIDPKGASREIRYRRINDRSAHQLKYDTIRNCIFAVDIEPSAVDIAQLRLWLALVIDDEIDPNAISALDGHRNPLPLPNLECNILCGNSLIDEFEGIKLINESDIIGTAGDVMQVNLYQSAFDATLQRLIDKQQELFRCEDTEKKIQLLQDIDALREDVIMSQLRTVASADQLERYYETKNMASKPFILWQLDFARVFREKGGFDIIIGNPPYIGERKHKDVFYDVQNNSTLSKYYLGRMDFFYFFFHLAINIMRKSGYCSLITTNYFTTALGARLLRKDFKERTDIIEMINFNECKVFETALGQHNMITSFQKGHFNRTVKTKIVEINNAITAQEVGKILRENWNSTTHELSQMELFDGEEAYLRLTGTEQNGDPINGILHKISEGATDLLGNICNPLIGLESSLDEVYVLSREEIQRITNDDPIEMEHVKEFFKGSQIHRYYVEETSDKYILYLHEKIENIRELKGIWQYLLEHEAAIKARKGANLRGAFRRGNWWVLNTPRLDMYFEDEKIVTHYRSKSLRFALSSTPWYASRDVYYIVKQKEDISLKYILALLNSSLYYLWFYYRGKRKGDMLELYAKPLKETPIKEISPDQQQPFIRLVDSIIENKKLGKDTEALENQIDAMVYQLYGLTANEIQIIEKGESKYGKC